MSDTPAAIQAMSLARFDKLGRRSRETALFGLALAFIGVAVLWSSQPRRLLLAWLAAQLALTWWRFAGWRRFARLRVDPPVALALGWQLRLGCMLSGMLWGLLGLYHTDNLLSQVPVFVIFLLAGTLAGGTSSMAVDLVAALGFIWLAVLPIELRMLTFEAAPLFRGMGWSGLLYAVFLTAWARRMNMENEAEIRASYLAAERERELTSREERYRLLAHHDVLTGLPNRLSLQAELPGLLLAAARLRRRVAAIYLDLDHFKDINDSRGHRAGDQLLAIVARRLRSCVRPEDLVVRMGGDEFIVIAGEVEERAQLELLARRLARAVREPVLLDGDNVEPRASFGLAVYPDDGGDAEALLRHADMALYHAKSVGRNTHQYFAVDMRVAFAERIFLQEALTRALEEDQLFLEFQPLVELASGRLVGMEVLLRWRHPERGLIAPMQFIPVAEHSGLINALGEHVLDLLCRQLADWRRQAVPLVPVSVNVSPWQFEHGRIAKVLAAAAAANGIEPDLLQVEITETALITDAGNERQTIDELRRLGLKVVIDDFGIGYSSLSHLKHLAIDGLKIDRSFVSGMIDDERDAAIVRATLAIGRSLDIAVLAEGVESPRHLQALHTLGCLTGQGNFLHPPVGAPEARALLEQSAGGAPLPNLAGVLPRRRAVDGLPLTSSVG